MEISAKALVLFSTIGLFLDLGFISFCVGSPHSVFTHFEILKSHQIVVRGKRSSGGVDPTHGAITVTFYAFHKRLNLLLTPGMRVLHPKVQVVQVDEAGRARPHNIDSARFYSGTVNKDLTHNVVASESNGVWIVHIHTPEDFYAVEPLSFYDHKASQSDMIVYRASDVRADNHTQPRRFCDEIYLDEIPKRQANRLRARMPSSRTQRRNSAFAWLKLRVKHEFGSFFSAAINNSIHRFTSLSRDKRNLGQSTKKVTKAKDCDIMAVADYNLFKGIGSEKPTTIVQTLVHTYDIVDRIFRSTDFGDPFYNGYGIVLSGIIIHTNYSAEPSHYNSVNLSRTAKDILIAMTQHSEFTQYCLVHLSMQMHWGNTLGLAAVASADRYWTNGLCAAVGDMCARNVGVSTMTDAGGNFMTLKRYALVVAHEIGHNWGAQHDPHTNDDRPYCSPPSDQGGKFLMWPYSGMGKDPNSERFSPCSIVDIRKILYERAHLCLLGHYVAHHVCGDGLVDPSEECDPGFAFLDTDPCCAKNCRLRSEAQCSFRNAPCCTENCQIAPATHKCYPKGGLQPCFEASLCLGNDSMYCPQATYRPNRSPCGNQGWCWFGRCQSFCEKTGLLEEPPRDLRACECHTNATAMCRHCCLDKGIVGSKCQIVGGRLRDGDTCLFGHCQAGICVGGRNPDSDIATFPWKENVLYRRLRLMRGGARKSYGPLAWILGFCWVFFFPLV